MSLLTCDLCAEEYPTSRFPNLELGVVCDGCLTGKRVSKVDEAIKAKTKDMARQLASLDEEEVIAGLPKLKGVLSGVYREFGGPEGFASHFFWVIRQLSNRKPVPASVGSLMLTFMKLHYSIEQADEEVSARDMTDEQLRREMELEMMKLVMESAGDPEKRKVLDKVLSSRGLKIEEAESEEILASVEEEAGVEFGDSDLEAQLERIRAFANGDDDESQPSP